MSVSTTIIIGEAPPGPGRRPSPPSVPTPRARRTPPPRRVGPTVGQQAAGGRRRAVRSERGEGVISAAIAVLVMAFLGAAMWIAFSATMTKAQSKVDNNVTSIGADTGGGTGGGVGGTGLP